MGIEVLASPVEVARVSDLVIIVVGFDSMATRAEEKPVPWAEKDMNMVLREADLARTSLPLAGCVKEVIKAFKIRRGIAMPVYPD